MPPRSPAEKKRESLFSDEVTKVTGSLTNCPLKYSTMDGLTNEREQNQACFDHDKQGGRNDCELTEQKREQIKALVEKMKREGKPIDLATAVFC